jgi:hypothetical protein
VINKKKPVARKVPDRTPTLNEVREAVDVLARLRNELTVRAAWPILDEDIRQAIDQGRR